MAARNDDDLVANDIGGPILAARLREGPPCCGWFPPFALVVTAGARGWIDLQAGDVHVLGKGSKRRTVPLGRKAAQALRDWLQAREQTPWAATQTALFAGKHGTRLTAQAIWQRLKRRSLLAGLATPVHPHMLRHSFASHVLQSSGDLRAVQELLGHANIGTTQVYTRLDFQHLAKAYDAAHPRAQRTKR